MSQPRRRPDAAPNAEPDERPNRRTALTASLLAGFGVLVLCGSLIVATHAGQPRRELKTETAPHQPHPETTDTPPPSRAAPSTPTRPTETRPAYGAETDPAQTLPRNAINAPELSATTPETCALPPFDSSSSGQQAFYQASLTCLNGTWEPLLRAAHLPFDPAEVITVTNPVNTPCGSRSPTQTALYCNGTLYMTSAYYRDVERHGEAGVYFGQIAHEYGHHVQELAGIMDASWRQRSTDKGNSAARDETSRRLELQATCYGGMFLAAMRDTGAVEPKLLDEALNDAGQRGDYGDSPRSHGTPESNAAWVRQGYEKNHTYQCNTWLADPETVS